MNLTIVYGLITAIVCLTVAGIVLALLKHDKLFESFEELIAKEAANNIGQQKRSDNIVAIHNATVSHYDKEIADIIGKLEAITAEISRLGTELKYQQTRMNVVYPWFERSEYNPKRTGGVEWADQYPDREEEHGDDA